MIAMTTSNSIRVKPEERRTRPDRIDMGGDSREIDSPRPERCEVVSGVGSDEGRSDVTRKSRRSRLAIRETRIPLHLIVPGSHRSLMPFSSLPLCPSANPPRGSVHDAVLSGGHRPLSIAGRGGEDAAPAHGPDLRGAASADDHGAPFGL